MHLCYRNQRLYLFLFILSSFLLHSTSIDIDDKPKQSDETDKTDAVPPEVPIDPSTDPVTNTIDPDEPIQSKQNLIIKYRIEKEEQIPEKNLDINIQDILQDIDNESQKDDPLNNIDDDASEDFLLNEEEMDYYFPEEYDEIPLTPEMEQADTIYHEAMKLINGTTNRQYPAAYKLLKQAADLGRIEAKEELAYGHIMGVYLPMDFNQARVYFEEGVETGSSYSHYGLYFLNSVGLIPNASISKALVHLTFAATDGNRLAQMALANRYWRSINVVQNCELALMYYQRIAKSAASKITTLTGQIVQRVRLFDEEEHPILNTILNDNNLLQYYQLLADRGDPQAQYGLGHLYYLRNIVLDKALHYFRLAANNGNVNALAYLGKLYSEKNEFIKQDNETALYYFQRATEKGNPIGQAGLGLAYYHGSGVPKSYEKALKLFQLSADQSYVEGQLMLGVMYYNGEGVKRDFKMAIKWFQAASQSGHVLAYYNLAQMHATGTGVLRSCPIATELFKNVAERGRWSAMFIDAFNLYKDGFIESAFMIYLYLAEIGYETAQSNVAFIIDQMPLKISKIYKTKEERYKNALTYWNRAAVQGFHHARIKLGDYYYYGHGTEQSYELAAGEYKLATDQNQNSQAMFNLAYMYEKGLGLKRDLHLAKRFYDMAVEVNPEASLPVAIVLLKLQFESFFEKLFSWTSDKPIDTKENELPAIDLDLSWDLYLMAALLGLIGALYTIRRQRAALRQQGVQRPVQ